MSKLVATMTKHERLSDLLRRLGHDQITIEEFWQQMRKFGLTDEQIDAFCRGEHIE